MGQYLSIPTLLKARFRKVQEAGSPRFWVKSKMQPGTSSLRDEFQAASRLSDELTNFLVEMDKKLDAILSFMEQETIHDDFPFEGRVVQLSGAHMHLETLQPIVQGEFMEVVLTLQEFPLRIISAIAQVEAAIVGPTVTDPAAFSFQLVLTSLPEEDRDAIIAYVFQEERRRIRMQKNGAEQGTL